MQNQLVTAYKGHEECSSALAVDPGIEDCFTLYTMSCYASSNEQVQIQHALDRGVTRPSRQEVFTQFWSMSYGMPSLLKRQSPSLKVESNYTDDLNDLKLLEEIH